MSILDRVFGALGYVRQAKPLEVKPVEPEVKPKKEAENFKSNAASKDVSVEETPPEEDVASAEKIIDEALEDAKSEEEPQETVKKTVKKVAKKAIPQVKPKREVNIKKRVVSDETRAKISAGVKKANKAKVAAAKKTKKTVKKSTKTAKKAVNK